ncbi:glycosyltransferase family 4 protein [Natrononativus amylolyticus]|uniref:glycosyltransferase family 4 protein n=1 Tax=Natrononativus amylolyticus TaxID=2963434 RepID=UPI0020CD3898|nr:glycosyltransferase family 4 protein [Natrononativus amylolyticus]
MASPETVPPEVEEPKSKTQAPTQEPEKVLEADALKILRVASDVYPEVMGGLSLHVHEMSRVQAEMGHDVTVLTSDHGDRDQPSREERDGYELIRHREVASPLDNTITPGLARTLRRIGDDYDVIHAHSHLFFSTNVAAAVGRTLETPLVVTNHGLMSQTAPKWVQKAFIPTVAKFTLNSADEILCYTETDKRRLRERGIDSSISVVHNGIDCEQFSPIQSDKSKNQILFVGRIKPGKGVRHLLAAFSNIISEFPEYSLKIVGDGPLREELVALAEERDISSNVEFVGQIENSEVAEVYAESEIFVLPSLNEGLPRTVLEAMACEVPVIVSDLEQLESLVEEAGVTVPRENPDILASEMKRLLANKELRTHMGRVGRECILDEYSWDETVRFTTCKYRSLI